MLSRVVDRDAIERHGHSRVARCIEKFEDERVAVVYPICDHIWTSVDVCRNRPKFPTNANDEAVLFRSQEASYFVDPF